MMHVRIIVFFFSFSKKIFFCKVRGSEGVRGYLIVPSGGMQVGWKLKESSQNRFFSSLDDLVKQLTI